MTEREKLLFAILSSILEMSDKCEKLGGPYNISGIASAAQMQKSIQKNKARILSLFQDAAKTDD